MKTQTQVLNSDIFEHLFMFCKRNLNMTSALRLLPLRAAGGHFVSAGGSHRSLGDTLVNYKGDNISKYVHLSVKIDSTQK